MKHPPSSRQLWLARWLGVAALPIILLVSFSWASGWLTPGRVTQSGLVSEMEGAGSYGHGFRRAHAKGMCVTGRFDATGNAASLSSAAVLRERNIPVVGRFALGTGQPYEPDKPAIVRSMALRLLPPDAPEWRTGMNDPPALELRDAQDAADAFASQRLDPKTGKPDQTRLKAFRDTHPWLQHAADLAEHRFVSSGFADDTFHSQNSFILVSRDGRRTPVRWAMVPVQTVEAANQHVNDRDYLFHDLIDALKAHSLQWRLMITIAGPHDVVDDPSQVWSTDDQEIDAGLLTLTKAQSEDEGACTGISYDPLVLPPGIVPSGDPILDVRSAAYMRSFALRAGEHHSPSAIAPNVISGGQK